MFAGPLFQARRPRSRRARRRCTSTSSPTRRRTWRSRREQLKPHRELVQQAYKLFGSHHYDHYDFLFALSRPASAASASSTTVPARTAPSPATSPHGTQNAPARDLLAARVHAFVERQVPPPGRSVDAELQRADGRQPALGLRGPDPVLGLRAGRALGPVDARAGARRAGAGRGAATPTTGPASRWRNVQDTTNDPVVAQRRPLPYRNYQMSEDYYSAGQLIWLAVDAKLRELTHEQALARRFRARVLRRRRRQLDVKTYTFDDVVAALNGVAPYDWAAFLRARLDAHAPPLDGLAASGWKLVYTDKPSAYQKTAETDAQGRRLLRVDRPRRRRRKDGKIADVRWNGPAFKAGIAPAGTLIAVQRTRVHGTCRRDPGRGTARPRSTASRTRSNRSRSSRPTGSTRGSWCSRRGC